MLACPPHRGETSATLRGLVPDTPAHHHRTCGDGLHVVASSVPCDHETEDATLTPMGEALRASRSRRPSSRILIRAERPTLDSHTLPLSRNETIRDRPRRPPNRNKTIRPRDRARSRTLRDRPLNRETLNDRPAPPTAPHPAAHHPEQTIKRGKHDSQTSPKDGDARIDDEPLHHETHRAAAGVTTTRKPAPGAHTTRVVERARKRNTVAETHFQSDLSSWMGRLVCCQPLSHRLTQRQYRSPPARPQSPQPSPDPR